MDFCEMMNMLFAMQAKCPDMEWKVNSNGVLSIQTYVGMEAYDLTNQGRAMFAPAD